MNEFGLSAKDMKAMTALFYQTLALDKVVIFGSRAMGNYQPSSDIDLALFGAFKHKEDLLLKEQLEELPMPYIFDLIVFDTIKNNDFREHIQRVGKVFYKR